jgi:hypothetical protein
MPGYLRNNYYFRQFFIKCSFMYIIIEMASLTPKVLGQLAQLSMEQ